MDLTRSIQHEISSLKGASQREERHRGLPGTQAERPGLPLVAAAIAVGRPASHLLQRGDWVEIEGGLIAAMVDWKAMGARSRLAPLPSGNMVAGMLMPLGQLRSIYELLFRDGVLVGQKDPRPHSFHPELPGVSHLQVWRAMGSLRSRGLVRENFAWRHCYWYLTDEGIAHLRQHLRLPPEIVPTTLQRARRPLPAPRPASRPPGVQAVRGPLSQPAKPREGWRQEYRRKDAAAAVAGGPVESASRRAGLPPASSSDEGQTSPLGGSAGRAGVSSGKGGRDLRGFDPSLSF
ncbi:hypothetical protein Chor_010554 [Crotalus horridus]